MVGWKHNSLCVMLHAQLVSVQIAARMRIEKVCLGWVLTGVCSLSSSGSLFGSGLLLVDLLLHPLLLLVCYVCIIYLPLQHTVYNTQSACCGGWWS